MLSRPGEELRAARAVIDLDALGRNAGRLSEEGLALRAVLKADAYGHGALRLATHLARAGVERFAVALVEEGIALRRHGVAGDILVMGPDHRGQRQAVVRNRLTPTISNREQLAAWLDRPAADEPVGVHLKVNTGMNRLGLAPGDLPAALDAVRSSSGLELAGLMSHFASADLVEDPSAGRQLERFEELAQHLTERERREIEIHIANSAGLLNALTRSTNVARPGLALLGYDPGGVRRDLEPVMSIVASVGQVHQLSTGEAVGYGGRWRAERPSRVGVVPLGYADGYPWRLGNRAEVLVEGRRVPVVGAVSMDMLSVDLTGTAAGPGSEVVLLGHQGDERITATELAERASTLVYETLCGLGLRLPRVYVVDGVTASVPERDECSRP